MRDITTLLQHADPSPDTPGFSDDERASILRRALSDEPAPRRRRALRIGAVAAASALVATLGFNSVSGMAASARADEILALAAINAVDPKAEPDQWWRVETSGEYTYASKGTDPRTGETDDSACIVRKTRTDYVAVDGSRPSVFVDSPGTIVEVLRGHCELDFSARERVWGYDTAPAEEPASWQQPTPAFLAGLPRDTNQLRARLYADSEGKGSDPDSQVHVQVIDALSSGIVPADLRAALFEVLQTVPGTQVTDQKVMDGRTVVMIGISDPFGTNTHIVIDADSGELVGTAARNSLFGERSVSAIDRSVVDEVPADVMAKVCVSTAEGELLPNQPGC